MDYKVMLANAKRPTDTFMRAQESRGALTNVDGIKRWFDENQEIQFTNPQFRGFNAEFSILGDSFQRIWFSQLTMANLTEDLNSYLLDEIIFKGECPCKIAETFPTAEAFWKTVSGKKFRVNVIGTGFIRIRVTGKLKARKVYRLTEI